MVVKGESKRPRPSSSTLGGRIRLVRKAWRWTQEDLAKAVGNDRQIVSYWELNKFKPTRSAMQLLAKVLKLPVEALDSGDGFFVPELPSTDETSQGMESLRRSLEDLASGCRGAKIQAVNIENGAIQSMTLTEATAFLERSHKDGLKIWVVASPLQD